MVCMASWKEVKTTTIRNCWNKTELLLLARIDCPHPEIDATLEELAELLKVFAAARDQELSLDDVIAPEDEYSTECPDGEDQDLVLVEEEAEDADDDVPPKAMKLTEARDTFLKCKLFLEESQDDPNMRPCLPPMLAIVRAVENKIYSSRTAQPSIKTFFRPEPPAGGA